jgi:hypothetical protein
MQIDPDPAYYFNPDYHGAVAEGRFELGTPVISGFDEKMLPLHRRGTPVHLESGLRLIMDP